MPCTPIADRASRTSSSLKGLMIAVTSFMRVSVERPRRGREVEVGRPLGALAGGTLDREVIVGRVEVLRREELPAAADVELLVIDLGVGAGIRVVDVTDVEAKIAEGVLVAAVEVHLDVAARIAR